jgi:hypothetical protein
MSAVEQLREVVGTLISATGPRPMTVGYPAGGPRTDEQKIAALEHDVVALNKGLEWIAGQLDVLSVREP